MTSLHDASIADLLDESSVPGREAVEEPSSNPIQFFGFADQPFADSVNPELFYRTEAHEAAFIAMRRCIEQDVSIGLTTAISGTGKTLLTQVLLQELDPRKIRPVLVLIYPKMSRTALLIEICRELNVEIPTRRPTTHDLVDAIQHEIMNLYLHGIKTVFIIDEVHFLTADNLQVLRTLSNIEVPEKKLVTILLFGEESFLPKLERPVFRSILSRMFTRVQLRPLTTQEVEQYVKYRLLLARGSVEVFEPACYPWLAEKSNGIPREINRICHNALQAAAEMGRKRISADILQDVAG